MQQPSIVNVQIQQQYRQLKHKVEDEIRLLQQKLSSNSEIHYHRSITGPSISRHINQSRGIVDVNQQQQRGDDHFIKISKPCVGQGIIDCNINSAQCHHHHSVRSHSRCHHHNTDNNYCHLHNHNNHHLHYNNNHNRCSSSSTSSRCNNNLNNEQRCSRRESCSISQHNYQYQPNVNLLEKELVFKDRFNDYSKTSRQDEHELIKQGERVLQQQNNNNMINPFDNMINPSLYGRIHSNNPNDNHNNNTNTMFINQKLLHQNIMLQQAYIKSVQQQQQLASSIRQLEDKLSRLQFNPSTINSIDNVLIHNNRTPTTKTTRSEKRSNSYQFRVMDGNNGNNFMGDNNYEQNGHYNNNHQHQQEYHNSRQSYQHQNNNNNKKHNTYQNQKHHHVNQYNTHQISTKPSNKNNQIFDIIKSNQPKQNSHQNSLLSNHYSNKSNCKKHSTLSNNRHQHINDNINYKKNSINSSRTNSILSHKSIINRSTSRSNSKPKPKSNKKFNFNLKNKPHNPKSDVSQQYMITKVKSQTKIIHNNKPSTKNIKQSKGDQNNYDYFGYDKLCPVHLDPKLFNLNSKQKEIYKDSNYRNRKHQRDHLIESFKQQQIARKKIIQKILKHNNNNIKPITNK